MPHSFRRVGLGAMFCLASATGCHEGAVGAATSAETEPTSPPTREITFILEGGTQEGADCQPVGEFQPGPGGGLSSTFDLFG